MKNNPYEQVLQIFACQGECVEPKLAGLNRRMAMRRALVAVWVGCALWGVLEAKQTQIVKHLRPVEVVEPSGMEGVDCIYVVNLDERRDRWERTQGYFLEQGLRVNRVSAVNGWKFPEWKKALLTGPYTVNLTGGAIGCLLSHISIYKDACERGYKVVWIVEDDIEFVEGADVLEEYVKALSLIDPEWDILYTDYRDKGEGDQKPRPGQELYKIESYFVSSDLKRIHSRHGTHSMIFSQNGLRKALDFFTHNYLWSPIDTDIHFVPGIREYSVTRDIVTVVRSGSDSDTVNGSILNR